MTNHFRVAAVALALTTACLAQGPLVTVSSKENQKWSAAEVDRIYLSACSAVQKEFGDNRTGRPRVKLVLGKDKNGVDFENGEVWLVQWDRDLFAQGVVELAFWDLMTPERRAAIAKRALRGSDARIEAQQVAK
jgi:hypothetical protein